MRSPNTGQRGPVEHERREQILAAADEHFRHYGYRKTTVADIAKTIGLSTAYVYKFFESKQAVGEAICAGCLGKMSTRASAIADEPKPAVDRLRRIFKGLAQDSADLLLRDRKMHALVTASFDEKWQSAANFDQMLCTIVQRVLQQGREAGEFERKTPLSETARAIMLALESVKHPYLLEQRLDTIDEDAGLVANLVLRSLAP